MWVPGQIPADLQGRSAVITGSTSGLGLELAKLIASLGAHVVVTGRTKGRCEEAAKVVRSAAKSDNIKVIPVPADLANMQEVRKLALEVRKHFDCIDMLFLNSGMAYAGYQGSRLCESTGQDLLYSSNFLGPFLLTNLLLDNVKRSTLPGRICFTGSVLQYCSDIQRIETHPPAGKGLEELNAYASSKLLLNIFAAELGSRLKESESKIIVRTVAPGMVNTNIAIPIEKRNLIHASTSKSRQLVPRRFEPADAAAFLLTGVFPCLDENQANLHLCIFGPYLIPPALTWNRHLALGLWLVENFQKLTHYPGGLYTWPLHDCVADTKFRKKLYTQWEEEVGRE